MPSGCICRKNPCWLNNLVTIPFSWGSARKQKEIHIPTLTQNPIHSSGLFHKASLKNRFSFGLQNQKQALLLNREGRKEAASALLVPAACRERQAGRCVLGPMCQADSHLARESVSLPHTHTAAVLLLQPAATIRGRAAAISQPSQRWVTWHRKVSSLLYYGKVAPGRRKKSSNSTPTSAKSLSPLSPGGEMAGGGGVAVFPLYAFYDIQCRCQTPFVSTGSEGPRNFTCSQSEDAANNLVTILSFFLSLLIVFKISFSRLSKHYCANQSGFQT